MSVSLIQLSDKEYTPEERDYILSKVLNIEWSAISSTLREFWLDWRGKTN
jgi:hypothetical protein